MNFKRAKKLILLFLASLTSASFAANSRVGKAAFDLLNKLLNKTDLVQLYNSMNSIMNKSEKVVRSPVGRIDSKVIMPKKEFELKFESLLSRYLTGTFKLRKDVNDLLKKQMSLITARLLERFKNMTKEEQESYIEDLLRNYIGDYTIVGQRVVSRAGDENTGREGQQHGDMSGGRSVVEGSDDHGGGDFHGVEF